MATFLDIHPVNPQARLIDKAVQILRGGGVIAYPTDSGWALGAMLDNREVLDRIRSIRKLDDKHHFTLVCHDFAQLGQMVFLSNADFRLVKRLTPGPWTFVLEGTREVPKRMLNPKKQTVGVRIPDHTLTRELLAAVGEPLISSTLIMPDGRTFTTGWEINEALGNVLDAVIEGEASVGESTTVLDLTGADVEILREGAGDIELL